jgi:hypothetical protein
MSAPPPLSVFFLFGGILSFIFCKIPLHLQFPLSLTTVGFPYAVMKSTFCFAISSIFVFKVMITQIFTEVRVQ